MIEPMIRYNFVLYHGDVKPFMERLRDVGVVDITLSEWEPSLEQRAFVELTERYKQAYQRLGSVKGVGEDSKVRPFATTLKAVEAYESAAARLVQLDTLQTKAIVELDELAMWGEFDPLEIKRLRDEDGISLRFFEVVTKQYKSEWEREHAIQVVASNLGGETYFVIAQPISSEIGQSGIDLGISVVEVKAPEMTFSQKEAQIEDYINQESEQQSIMARSALSQEAIWADYLEMKDQITFDNVLNSGELFADDTIKIVEGWSTVPNQVSVEAFANSEEVIFTAEKAMAEQNPPIKLKNHFFARLFEPIGSLYMLPRYNEMDMTPYFAPFFMVFFGVCFGDAGYGLLFILVILGAWKKIPAKWRDFAWLALFLNISTVFFGLMTGSFFGIELAEVPALVEFKKYIVTSDNMFNVSIGMGAVQILFAQILHIFNRSKQNGSFLYGLSTLGWVILMISGLLAFGEIISTDGVLFYSLISVAGVLILFFNSPKKNPLVNLGSGLYNCYEMGTGVVGDLISYVRLFAIGLAGAIIAQVFNALSVGLSGDIPVLSWIFMGVILLIGHGLNIFISILGAFVHPVRLTFVEFYKNTGFEGGGRKFIPFKRFEK